jgi:hypothetical protein
MVLPTRDEDRLPADFTTRQISDCTLLDTNPGSPVFYALGCRKAVRRKPVESTSDLKEVSNEKQVGSGNIDDYGFSDDLRFAGL